MKAAIYPGGGKPITIEDVPDPTPERDEVIIKVHRCGVCGTDLHMTEGGAFEFPHGCTPGHEYAGEVVELGAGVSTLRKGDIITALPSRSCGRCEACARGNPVLCRNAPGTMGGFAEFNRVPASMAITLPSALSLADGALIEPLAVGLYGVRLAAMEPGERVLVLGAGSVALCAIYWARRFGAGRIVAMSRSERRKPMALAMGADAFVQYGADELKEAAEALGGAPSLVFECVGNPGFLGKAIQHAKVYGKVASLGFCTSPDPILPAMAGYKGVTLQFPVGYSLQDFQHVAEVMDKGHVDPKALITSVAPLNNLPDTLAKLRGPNAETKVHIDLSS